MTNVWSLTFVLMVCASILWFAIEAVFATLRRYSVVEIVWARYCIHLICMLIILGPRQAFRDARTKKVKLHIFRGVLMIAMPLFGFMALSTMGSPEFKSVFWLLPLIVILFARFLLRQKINFRYWGVTLSAYVGALIVFRPGFDVVNREAVWAVSSGASFSLYIVLTHKLQRTQSLNTNLIYTALVVALALTPALPFIWKTPSLFDGSKMVMIGVLGLVALWCLEKAMETSQPAILAPALFLVPIWGGVMRWGFLGSMPRPSDIIGSFIIIACLVVHHILEIKAEKISVSKQNRGVRMLSGIDP